MGILSAIQLSSIAWIVIAATVVTSIAPFLWSLVPYGSVMNLLVTLIAFLVAGYRFWTNAHSWLFSVCVMTVIAHLWLVLRMNREAYSMGAMTKRLAQKEYRQELRRLSEKSELSENEKEWVAVLEAASSVPVVPYPRAISDRMATWDIAITFVGWLLTAYAFSS